MRSLRSLRRVLRGIFQRVERPADPFAGFTARDWADLPRFHPSEDEEGRWPLARPTRR